MPTDTPTDAQILEEMAEAEEVEDPTSASVQKGKALPSDSDTPGATMVRDYESAGWVKLYDIRDGREFPANLNMVPYILKKTDEFGVRVFTARKPDYEPQVGNLLCLLNPKHKDYAEIEELGLPACKKHTLPNPYQVNSHMRRKHKDEWKVLEERKAEIRLVEESDFRKASIASMNK